MRYDKEREEFVNYTVGRNNHLRINIETDSDNFTKLGSALRPIKLSGQELVADTGALLCCSPVADINKYDLNRKELLESNLTLYAVNKRKLHIKGYIPVKLNARTRDGSFMETSKLLYFFDGLNKTYL